MPDDTATPDVDPGLGATGERLQFWKAKEAFRQGELKLTQQSAVLDGLRLQATSLLGWSVTIGVALAAAALTKGLPDVAVVVVTSITITAALCIGTLWVTSGWRFSSFNPLQIMDNPLGSELEVLESLALGSQDSIVKNRRMIGVRSQLLRMAWISFAAMPIVGLLAYPIK